MTGETHDGGVIRVSGMRFWGKHGANPGERDREQPIDLDFEVSTNLDAAATSDSLADTVDYAAMYKICEQIVTQQSFVLLEALADRIAQALSQDPKVVEVVVRARKPRLLEGATPEVEVRRRGKH